MRLRNYSNSYQDTNKLFYFILFFLATFLFIQTTEYVRAQMGSSSDSNDSYEKVATP